MVAAAVTLAEDFADLAVQTVSVKHPTGTESLYGKRALGVATVYKARVVSTEKQLRMTNGDEVVARTVAEVFGAEGLSTECEITLPDGSKPPVLSVESFPDETGDHYERVYFGGGG